ncbi:MAG TPA: polysaccharide biosynthesis/export family protein [Pyrinomonadaceae bacterium]|jgi:protein involved in polysaccharide export with SLBB domain
MKKFLPAIAIVLAIGCQLSAARAQNNDAHAAQPVESGGSSGSTAAEGQPANGKGAPEKTEEAHKPPAAAPATTTAAAVTLAPSTSGRSAPTTDAPAKSLTNMPGAAPSTASAASSASAALTNLYRVGVGDVLDIRLLNASRNESTLFTVMEGGLLEYPLAGDPLAVAGKTTDEIGATLTSKVRIYEKPQLVVSVRQYGSHNVILTGLVNDPGTKSLRREAVPLYVLLAEAQLRPEAGQATIMRAGTPGITVNLADSTQTSTLVYPGDVITLSAAPPKPPQFFFIGGQINSPGQKDFHAGLTLTQAILASGGVSRFAGSRVKVMRQGPDGRLVTTEYNLKQIESGKVPDPQLQPGDRLEISRSGW